MKLTSVTLQVRRPDDDIEETELSSVSLATFDSAVPWRGFRWYRGQRHYSGGYWCATTSGPVGYESRLELGNLMLEDFDPHTPRECSCNNRAAMTAVIARPRAKKGCRGFPASRAA